MSFARYDRRPLDVRSFCAHGATVAGGADGGVKIAFHVVESKRFAAYFGLGSSRAATSASPTEVPRKLTTHDSAETTLGQSRNAGALASVVPATWGVTYTDREAV